MKRKGAVPVSTGLWQARGSGAAEAVDYACRDPKAKEQAVPLLQFMGQKVYDFGNMPELANIIKVSGNFS